MPPSRLACLYCEHVFSVQNTLRSQSLRWQTTRSLTQLQRRRQPSRMALSPNVAQPRMKNRLKKKPATDPRNGPFGGMNIKTTRLMRLPSERASTEPKKSKFPQTFQQKSGTRKKGNEETFRALKMQQALAKIPYGHRNSIKSRISDIDSFEDFQLLSVLRDAIPKYALIGSGELVPSPIQRLAIPALLGSHIVKTSTKGKAHAEEKHFLLAAETGSGKTLAYVLPLIDSTKRTEIREKEEADAKNSSKEAHERKESPYYVEPPAVNSTKSPNSTSGRPRAIVLVPTAELVDQVTKVFKSLSHVVKFRAAAISSSFTPQVIQNRLFSSNGIDILVSTPHLLSSIAESDPNVLSRVTHLVIDEADSLMDRSFAPITTGIIDKATPSLKQLIMCSATIPRSLDNLLRHRFPNMRRLVTPNLHAIPRRVQLSVIDVDKDPYRGNKNLACADTIYMIGKSNTGSSATEESDPYAVKFMLVFVNEREKTEELADYLQSKGIDALALHRDLGEGRRNELLSQFTAQPMRMEKSLDPPSSPSTVKVSPAALKRLKNVRVLVTTDLGSRGIDTLAVRNVILYNVPHSTIDFIHRLGRTGRMGRRGRGVVLVGKDDRKDIVREVREGMFRGQALI